MNDILSFHNLFECINIFKSMRYKEGNYFNCNNGTYFNAIGSVITVKVKPRLTLEIIGIKDERY